VVFQPCRGRIPRSRALVHRGDIHYRIIRIFSDLPLLSHEVGESRGNIALLLVLFVLSLISPLLCLAGILILLGLYMRRIDKIYRICIPGLSSYLSFLLQGSSGSFLQVSSSGTHEGHCRCQ